MGTVLFAVLLIKRDWTEHIRALQVVLLRLATDQHKQYRYGTGTLQLDLDPKRTENKKKYK